MASRKVKDEAKMTVRAKVGAVNIHSAPNAQSPIVGVITGNTPCCVEETAKGWGKLPGDLGYVDLSYTTTVE